MSSNIKFQNVDSLITHLSLKCWNRHSITHYTVSRSCLDEYHYIVAFYSDARSFADQVLHIGPGGAVINRRAGYTRGHAWIEYKHNSTLLESLIQEGYSNVYLVFNKTIL